jgi:hypothetical protein
MTATAVTAFAGINKTIHSRFKGMPIFSNGVNSCLIFVWLIYGTYFRFQHSGKVCSGDYLTWEEWYYLLQQDNYAPYLIIKGAFLKTYIVLWWTMPLSMFGCFMCFHFGSNRLISDDIEQGQDLYMDNNRIRKAGVGLVSLNQTHRQYVREQ